MQALVFLGWSLGFWPMFAIAVLIMQLSHPKLVDQFGIFVVGVVWVIGCVHTYRLYRSKVTGRSLDDDEEDVEVDPDPNTLFVIEAPDAALAHEIGDCIEREVFLGEPLSPGKRLVLNEDDTEPVVLGTVDEVTDCAVVLGDNIKRIVWFAIDRPEDYRTVYQHSEWTSGSTRRSSRPLSRETVQ